MNRHDIMTSTVRLYQPLILIVSTLLLLSMLLTSCGTGSNSSADSHDQIDDLNEQAYKSRYVSIEQTLHYAEKAQQQSTDYPDGLHEALCHKAFTLSMQADYAAAKNLYRRVCDESKNELLMLVADIGMMELCQRTSSNKEYYDYRNQAQRHLQRLESSQEDMNAHQLLLWNYAQSEYHFVSTIYDFYMNQRQEARQEMRYITDNTDCIRGDTAQIAKYCYLLGSGGLMDDDSDDDNDNTASTLSKEEDRNLMRCFSVSVNKGLTFFIASSLQSWADNLLYRPQRLEQKDILVLAEYVKADYNDTNQLPLMLARRSHDLFSNYGSPFNANAPLITISDYYINSGQYTLALDTLQTALNNINIHLSQHADSHNKTLTQTPLLTYDSIPATTSTEKQWIESRDPCVNPLWMSSVREYLSICYSGMGNKAAADYNRNVYLDILDATRQDMEIENRYDKLSNEKHTIDILLVSLLALLLLLVTLFVLFYRRQMRNKQQRKDKLMQLLDICRKMTAALPSDADDADDIRQAIDQAIDNDIRKLIPNLPQHFRLADMNDKNRPTTSIDQLRNYDRELIHVVSAFYDWLISNGEKVVTLNNRMQMTESRRFVHEKHVKENKCANIDKQACMSVVMGIMPYIDRMTNELSRLTTGNEDEAKRADRLRYLEELVDKINADNEILVHWIKMSQGTLNLNIETFSLQPLFEMFGKNKASFESRGIKLEVEPTDSNVKADRALTIFMVNTLLDNAMKYTPAGGTVRLTASTSDYAVEIAVSDSGRGLSADDIQLICGEKFYDASRIGMSQDNDHDSAESNRQLAQQKGFGFGLMNCKGIIEKYRKTNKLFAVCRFSVESELGKGSRFHFTLPKGVTRAAKMLLAFVVPLLCGCTGLTSPNNYSDTAIQQTNNPNPNRSIDSLRIDSASHLVRYHVDNVYYNNVDGYYEEALLSADSAIHDINVLHHLLYPTDTRKMLPRYEDETPAELEWYKENHDMAYNIILDLRNEMAIAALALKRWDIYYSNNETYTRMYRLVGQDKSLEQTCNNLQMANINKQTVLVVLIAILVLAMLLFFMLYYKFYLLHILNMEQYISFSKHVLSTDYSGDDDGLDKSFVNDLFRGISDVKLIDAMALVVNSDNGKGMLTAVTGNSHHATALTQYAQMAYQQSKERDQQANIVAYPMTVSGEEGEQTIGGIALALHGGTLSDDEEIILRLMVQLTSIYLNNSLIQLNVRTNNIELMEDEERRTEHEENIVHVQNMILDNCLSTIKHETMYYPNRIKQLLSSQQATIQGEELSAVNELASYYKDIYTILSANALRQVSGKTFRRAAWPINIFADYARRSFDKMKAKRGSDITLDIGTFTTDEVFCDKDLIEYLIDNLLLHAFETPLSGQLRFEAQPEERFMAFRFTDYRQSFSQKELNNLFYPDNIRYDSRTDRLLSTQLIVCKQIVREHDEHSPFRGCRIYAEPIDGGDGYTIVFSIPRKKNKTP